MKPTFLGIGPARCGSTWLHRSLALHPDIQMSDPKQVCYFNQWILSRDLEWYWRHFDPAEGDHPAPVRGEVTPFYARLSQPSVDSIARLLPDAGIVLTLRNPIDRCWSGAHLDLGHYGKNTLKDLSPGTFFRYFERARVRRYTDYSEIIRRWRSAFGPAQVHIALFDDIKGDPIPMLEAIYRHVGADPSWKPPLEEVAPRVRPEGSGHQDHEMPEIVRWYLADLWHDRVVGLNHELEGLLDHWVAMMQDALGTVRPSWRLRRAILGKAGSWPEKVAFACYDALSEARLRKAWRRVGA
ncbi:MAG: hypothetical protein CMJ33_00630 [Phycisphaerae bacterium]|nr:hypothetical protein [Phycisphaerae bacterium]